MVDRARAGLVKNGPVALFSGILGGIPYKLSAIPAAGNGIGTGLLLLISVFARLSRLLRVTGLTWLAEAILLPNLNLAARLRIHAGVWMLFYLSYF